MNCSQPSESKVQGEGHVYSHGHDSHGVGIGRGKEPHRYPEFARPIRRGYDHHDLYEPLPLSFQQRGEYPDSPSVQQQPFSYGPHPHFSNYSAEASAYPQSETVQPERFNPEGGAFAQGARRSDDNASEDSADSRDGKVRQKKYGSKKRPLTAFRMFYRDERSKIVASLEKPNPGPKREQGAQSPDVSSRTGVSPRKRRKRSSQERLISRDELDRLVEAKWKRLGYSEREVYGEQARAESKLPADGAEGSIQDFLPESADVSNSEPAGNARSERYQEAKYGLESEMATPLVLARGPRTGASSLPSFPGRPEGRPHPLQMPYSHNSHQRVQQPDLSPQAPYPTQTPHRQPYTELAHHQSAMQFGDVRGIVDGGEAAPRDRLELPPSRTVMVHDANGTPRRYELMYAALSMPYEMAREYMTALSSTTNQLLDGSPGIQMASSASDQPHYNPGHRQPPAYQAPARQDPQRSDNFRDPPYGNFHSGN
jgi:hypothetical protein